MRKASLFCLTFGVHQIPDRAALHKDDGMMTVLADRSSRQTVNIFGFNCFQHGFEGECGHMMALIYNDHSVLCHKRLYRLFFSLKQGLHGGNIDNPTAGILSAADLANEVLFFLPAALFGKFRQNLMNIQKLFQRGFPLFQQCAGLHQYQSIDFALSNQIGANHSFSKRSSC